MGRTRGVPDGTGPYGRGAGPGGGRADGSGLKKKKRWIASAIKRPGALRAKAKRKGLIKGDEKLSAKDLKTLVKDASTQTKKQVALARTLGKMRKK